MTWFTFHLENCSDWKALPGQESPIVPSIWARSWSLLLPYSVCDWPTLAGKLRGLPEAASQVERIRVWAELGFGCSPRSCTGLLVLLQASPAPVPMSAAPQLSWVWPANMTVHSQKLCMTKAMLGCSTGSFYYPAYFKTFWFYDPVFFLWLNARFLCLSNSSLFSLMNSVHSNMYVLEQIQHKVPEEALKVRVAECSAFLKKTKL